MENKEEILMGSGELYMHEFDGTEIPEDAEIEIDEYNVGHCNSGFSIEYTPAASQSFFLSIALNCASMVNSLSPVNSKANPFPPCAIAVKRIFLPLSFSCTKRTKTFLSDFLPPKTSFLVFLVLSISNCAVDNSANLFSAQLIIPVFTATVSLIVNLFTILPY